VVAAGGSRFADCDHFRVCGGVAIPDRPIMSAADDSACESYDGADGDLAVCECKVRFNESSLQERMIDVGPA
jgi:hypothetical protein